MWYTTERYRGINNTKTSALAHATDTGATRGGRGEEEKGRWQASTRFVGQAQRHHVTGCVGYRLVGRAVPDSDSARNYTKADSLREVIK